MLALFGVYWYGISSPQAANAVSRATQVLKDGYARLWYLFPFSVVEWFYAAFILGMAAWAAVRAQLCTILCRFKNPNMALLSIRRV